MSGQPALVPELQLVEAVDEVLNAELEKGLRHQRLEAVAQHKQVGDRLGANVELKVLLALPLEVLQEKLVGQQQELEAEVVVFGEGGLPAVDPAQQQVENVLQVFFRGGLDFGPQGEQNALHLRLGAGAWRYRPTSFCRAEALEVGFFVGKGFLKSLRLDQHLELLRARDQQELVREKRLPRVEPDLQVRVLGVFLVRRPSF